MGIQSSLAIPDDQNPALYVRYSKVLVSTMALTTIHHGLVHCRWVVHQVYVVFFGFLDELLSNRYSSGLKLDIRLDKASLSAL